jgi:ribosomal protein S18 acetylase RimI-like enzyme
MEINIRQVNADENLETIVSVLHKAFGTVAVQFGLNEENNPSNPAFIKAEALSAQLHSRIVLYMLWLDQKPAGSVAIEKSPDQAATYYIERVGVVPEFRHHGFGRKLMEFAYDRIIEMGGKKASVAIINENTVLKAWYESLGFKETAIRKFDHLPFTVCFMHKVLRK